MTLDDSGTTTPTVDVASTLSTRSSSGVYAFEVDGANLTVNEFLTIEIFTKTLTGGSSTRLVRACIAWHSLNKKIIIHPIGSDIEYLVKLTQNGGTARAFPWKVLKA